MRTGAFTGYTGYDNWKSSLPEDHPDYDWEAEENARASREVREGKARLEQETGIRVSGLHGYQQGIMFECLNCFAFWFPAQTGNWKRKCDCGA